MLFQLGMIVYKLHLEIEVYKLQNASLKEASLTRPSKVFMMHHLGNIHTDVENRTSS